MRAWIGVAAAAGITLASEARANVAAPHDYLVFEDPPGNVSVYVLSPRNPSCPASGLLRKNVATGEVVRITTCEDGQYTDECVLAGTYQYGLAEPYSCDEGREARYYREITTGGFADVCVWLGDPPQAADGVPWEGRGPMVCDSADSGGSGCGTAGGGVLGANLAVLLTGLALWRWRAARRRPA